MRGLFAFLSARPQITALLVACGLALLPVAVWLDLRAISDAALRQQAADFARVMTSVRRYYAEKVVGRILSAEAAVQVRHDYATTPGAVPIPATLSIELSEMMDGDRSTIGYRFVSDHPFASRPEHPLDAFERAALKAFRARDGADDTPIAALSGTIFDRGIRLAAPVVMSGACVACHNAHPESPRRDWKVGDVRGIEEFTIRKPIAASVLSFKFLMIYLICAGGFGATFATLQWRQARTIGAMNAELGEANAFLSSISIRLARYLSPQIYASIFKGERDGAITTERKKLTIFFSDIKDFTATTERLQPEALTALLNHYLSEMTAIALAHGGTIDKYIGDAMLVFFGDPETRGAEADAKACLRMAVAMQRRMAELEREWRRSGVEAPFRIRCGINTGYCNVGNFGSEERMDYTIIGAEANLAARLESCAEAGGVMMSYETYALVRDIARAQVMPPIKMKGISRDIVPYRLDGLVDDAAAGAAIVSGAAPGLDLFLDVAKLDPASAPQARALLQSALDLLTARPPRG